MSDIQDSAQVLSRLALKGTIAVSVGSADAHKFVRTDENGVLDASLLGNNATLTSHIADDTKHLTSSQNTLLDNLTATYTELNYAVGVTSAIQTQLTTGASNLTTHIADETKHLTSAQNTFLDAVTASSTEVNYLVGVTSAVQTQIDTHVADATKHLTGPQNTWLDAITASSTEVNYLVGVTSAIQTQFAALNASALTTGTVPDARFPATLPALSGANLTALNGSNVASGTVPLARLPVSSIAIDALDSGTDITTNNVSASKHGLAPKLPGTTNTYFRGDGTYVAPSKWTVVTGPITAVEGNRYQVDTSAGVVTITLPASPSAGDEVLISDAASSFATNNLTINRNSNPINGAAADYTGSTNGVKLACVYINGTVGWSIK